LTLDTLDDLHMALAPIAKAPAEVLDWSPVKGGAK
jgi:hypothetical protein